MEGLHATYLIDWLFAKLLELTSMTVAEATRRCRLGEDAIPPVVEARCNGREEEVRVKEVMEICTHKEEAVLEMVVEMICRGKVVEVVICRHMGMVVEIGGRMVTVGEICRCMGKVVVGETCRGKVIGEETCRHRMRVKVVETCRCKAVVGETCTRREVAVEIYRCKVVVEKT